MKRAPKKPQSSKQNIILAFCFLAATIVTLLFFFQSQLSSALLPVFTKSPEESARDVATQYLKATLACDRKKIDQLSTTPMSDEKYAKCSISTKQPDGSTVSNRDLHVTMEKVTYDITVDHDLTRIETASMLPSVTYKGKPAGFGRPYIIHLIRYPDDDNKWKSYP